MAKQSQPNRLFIFLYCMDDTNGLSQGKYQDFYNFIFKNRSGLTNFNKISIITGLKGCKYGKIVRKSESPKVRKSESPKVRKSGKTESKKSPFMSPMVTTRRCTQAIPIVRAR